MAKAPAFQFYPADWQRDLSEHPLEIEGAWIRICCSLWWSDTPGTAVKPLTNWARVMRVGEKKSRTIIDYLDKQKIAEVDNQNGDIRITSRRMVKDEYIRNIRKKAGSKGGNPALLRNENGPDLDNQNLVNQKPTPSSSSSSSKKKEQPSGCSERARDPVDPPAKRAKPPCPMPDDFQVNDEMRDFALKFGCNGNLQKITDTFCDYHRAKGSRFKDWNAAWRNWIRNEQKFSEKSPPQSPTTFLDKKAQHNMAVIQDFLSRGEDE